MARTSTYKPGLAWFAALGSAWVFVLVALGAFTTTIGAGMAFADWPLSNGSINPDGWLEEIDKFAEHSHRLSGTVMGLVTIALAVWLQRREERAWLRKLGWWALGIVIFQGILGGKRVLLDSIGVPGFDMTLGQMLRIPHGVLAQVYVCVLFAIAAGVSRPWVENNFGVASARLRKIGWWCVALLGIQLIVATSMRHNHAGMAIGTFPFSTPTGDLLPAHWDYRVTLQFIHRVMAMLIGIAVLVYGHFLWREKSLTLFLRSASFLLVGLVSLQIYLGAQIIWTGRSVYMTTGHVIIGALTLATTFVVAFFTGRDSIERPRP
ncbi:COX15/CtaA family protein [Oleiharenicola lentus]|uniref:COX15/CtaA family protein n=1 Tax=Oleiharenicola lentus TaxID=2508720 RepID=UPI003F66454E